MSTDDSLMHLIYRVTRAQMAARVQWAIFSAMQSVDVESTSLTRHVVHSRGIQLPVCTFHAFFFFFNPDSNLISPDGQMQILAVIYDRKPNEKVESLLASRGAQTGVCKVQSPASSRRFQ